VGRSTHGSLGPKNKGHVKVLVYQGGFVGCCGSHGERFFNNGLPRPAVFSPFFPVARLLHCQTFWPGVIGREG